MKTIKMIPRLALLVVLAATHPSGTLAARIPTDKSELTQEIYLRCLYDMGEFGDAGLQSCMATDLAAAEALTRYPPEARPVIDRCFDSKWTQGYGSVQACVERDLAGKAALEAYGTQHAQIIQGCREQVGQQGAAAVKRCVDTALAPANVR